MALKNISNNLQFDFGVSEYHSNIVATNNYIAPQYGIGQQQTTTTTSSSSSSSQIRTSSPISSPSSEPTNLEELLANRHRVLPRFALRAVRSSQSLKRNTNKMAMPPPEMAKYPSMRELAYKKLREANALREMLEQHQIKSKGRLKLAVYANTATHLTVHIVEAMARTGVSKSETVAAYVKITQIPEDVDRRLVVKTRIIEPVDGKYHFNDKFSFEICQLNPNNRLIFALWTIDASTQDHLVGCFSFRIRNLLSSAFSRSSEASSSRRTASYWYHLLPFDLGVQRHIKCSSHHSSSSNQAQNHHQPKAPNVNSDLQGMEHVTLVLRRPDSSLDGNNEVTYGFTLSNSCPCQVSKVGLNSIAHRSGLRCGDFISRVNKVNVSRASCESVAKMIKQSRGDLVLDVYREPQNDQDDIEDNYNYYQVFCPNIPASKPINIQENKDDVLMVVDEEESDEPPFARMYASLKYVDSMTTSSSNNDDGDLLDDDYEAADKLRRAAANYVYLPLKNSSSNCNQHPPQVNNPCLDYNHLNRYHLHK